MARIRKEEDFNKKKLNIIKSALSILLEEGAEKLSVNYLLRKTDMSKGTFFHYFESKEALLADVLDYASKPIIESMKSVMKNDDLEAVDKFTLLYQSVGCTKAKYGKGLGALSKVLYRNENKLFLIGLMERTLDECLPIFEELILEGIESGDFRVESAYAAAFHVLTITMRLNQEIGEYLLSDQSVYKRKVLMEKIKLSENIVRSILNCDGIGTLYQIETLKRMEVL